MVVPGGVWTQEAVYPTCCSSLVDDYVFAANGLMLELDESAGGVSHT